MTFHVMIELSAEVQIFSYPGLAMLFAWADPSLPWLPGRGQVQPETAPDRSIVGAGA
jgi:hypothetical protein